MAYVNVAEWTSVHVGDWLKGLDDSILPYVQFFVNNGIDGCRLLLLNSHDLQKLNITKAGHQEIILEAVELLKQLHYNFSSETLQAMALKLSCRSRSLHNLLRAQAYAKAQREAMAAAKAAAAAGDDKHQKDHKHKKDKHHKEKKGEAVVTPAAPTDLNDGQGTPKDTSPVSTSTLHAVTEILSAVKEFMSWLDRYPFDGNEKYAEARKTILRCAIELASTAQRDQFVQCPNEVIRERCLEVADLCDKMIQRLSDSLAMQCASLEVVTVTKSVKEELGMHIHSSYSGIHQVGGLKYDSPACKNGNIEEGDEIVQVNYQTVVGWQLKKLVASMRQFPMKIILTVKKRPRHHPVANYTLISPFSLPIPDMTILTNADNRSHHAVLKNSEKFYGIPAPVVPVPDNAIMCSPPAFGGPLTPSSAGSHDSPNEFAIYSTGPQNPIPVSSSGVAAYASYQTNASKQTIINSHGHQPNIAPTSMIPQTLSQYNAAGKASAAKASPAKADKLSANQNTAVKSLAAESTPKSYSTKKQPHVHRSKNGTERKSRVATTRCSSASDSSPFSMSDSTSTMYTSSDDDGESTECNSVIRRVEETIANAASAGGTAPSKTTAGHDARGSRKPVSGFKSRRANANCQCTTDSEEYSGNDDNDSAFYSGRTTSNNDINGSGNSSGGSASGRCSAGKMPPSMLPPKVVQTLAQLKLANEEGKLGQVQSSPSPPVEMAKSGRTGRPLPIQPRTSAEFEALFLQKTASGSQESMPTPTPMTAVSNKVARASTLPPNAQPCGMMEHQGEVSKEGTHASDAKPEKCNKATKNVITPSGRKAAIPTMSEVQQKFVNSLTNLAQNIRVANTVSVNSVATFTANPGMSHFSMAHQERDEKLEALGIEIGRALTQLTNGDTNMGSYEDIMFIYRGGNENTLRSSPPRCETLPQLGPMIIDAAVLESSKWSKIHAVLQENTLYTCPVNSATVPADCNIRFELPVHLPGYYILVNKADLLAPATNSNPQNVLLYVFKLVTYHYLYLFATDSPVKIAQWINKFGYRFCCNPEEDQLCFTFYLSTPHAKKANNKCGQAERCLADQFAVEAKKQQASEATSEPSTVGSSTSFVSRAPSQATESELDTDDYKDLSLNEYSPRPSVVKFSGAPEILNQIPESPARTDDLTGNHNTSVNGAESSRRFAKSPHPLGSARYACRPLANNQSFIDSIVDPKTSLENAISEARAEAEEHISVEVEESSQINSRAQGKKYPPSPIPPQLPPRSSPAPAPATTPVEAPRPKPRTSKMTPTTDAAPTSTPSGTPPQPPSRPSVPAKDSAAAITSARSKAQSLVSNRQHLAPIPVPEKSAAISQTIQHFANLQRQNNLRRSSQQLNQLPTVAPPPPPPAKQALPVSSASAAEPANDHHVSYSDYDYIGGHRPTLTGTVPSTPPQAKPPSKQQSGSPGVGNPLYCVVPPPLHHRPPPPVPPAVDSSLAASALDREYSRLFGDKKPPLSTQTSDDSPSESSSSENTSSESSLPPPRGSPPPPPNAPPVIRDCVLKPGPLARPDIVVDPPSDTVPDSNNNIDDYSGTVSGNSNSFSSGKISSPKMIKKNKQRHGGVQSPTVENDEHQSNVVASNTSTTQSPPILLPRRSKLKQNTPPPLPTTSHPALSKANSNASNPPVPEPRSPLSPAILNAKSLNRSFSDAYTRTPSGRTKPRKSLESGLKCSPEQLTAQMGYNGNEPGLPPMPSTPTSRSIFLEQLLGTRGLAPSGDPLTQSTSDLSNRSLPTMGVSMLGKKRLSNVSSDCYSIEKALSAHNEKQCEVLRKPSITSFDGQLATSPLARSVSMSSTRPVIVGREDRHHQWDQIERTVVETTQRLLKH